MAEEAYYLDGSRNQQGPVAMAEVARLIRSGAIRRDTLVWYAGMPDWRPAGEVTEFASLFVPAAPPPRPPLPPLGARPSAQAPRFSAAAPERMSLSPGSSAGVAHSQRMASIAGAAPGQVVTARAGQFEHRMGFGKAVATCFHKYADFTGRARRKEYWFWHLFYWLALIGLIIVDGLVVMAHGPALLTVLGVLALFLPTLAGTVRRLHDTDHSGWMMFVGLIPLVGGIIFLVFMCQRGTTGPNRFGPDPLGSDVAEAFD